MLKHLVGLASQRNKAYMAHRSSAVTGLVSDSVAFNFPITLMSSDIRSDLQLVKVAPSPMKLMKQLCQLLLKYRL